MPEPPPIDQVIIDAILSGRIRAGMRLGEQQLATLFATSRTSVREALIRLETRGMIQVSPRRGWFVVEPSLDDAREAFQARVALETGILRTVAPIGPATVAALRDHVRRERDAIAAGHAALRSFLLGDFHVCMVQSLGNHLLAEILRDLTARTVLISALYQSTHDATESCDEHALIVDALAANDLDAATALMVTHIGHVEAGLTRQVEHDPLLDLRQALGLATPATPNAGPNPRPPRKSTAR